MDIFPLNENMKPLGEITVFTTLVLVWCCTVGVQGQIGVTTCSFATQTVCPTNLHNSYCDLASLLCKCATTIGYEENADGSGCDYNCGTPAVPENGAVNTSQGTLAWDVAFYSCNNGYKISGSTTTTCVEDVGWDNTAATCVQGEIGDACSSDALLCGNIAFGECHGSGICQCTSGYEDDGTGTNCQEIDECSSDPCQNAGNCLNVVNGYQCICFAGYTGTNCETNCQLDSDCFNHTVTDSVCISGVCGCQSGDQLVDNACLFDCGNPDSLPNGTVSWTQNETLQGNMATYSCNPGYTLIGNEENNCTREGWGALPSCEFGCLSDADCTEVTNSSCNTTTYKCLCEENYVIYSNKCVYDCGEPPEFFVNGTILPRSYLGTREGDIVLYYCPSNYIMSGSDIGHCEVGGWSGMQPLCLYYCGNPEVPTNGSVIENGQLEGDVATYSCDTGYKLIGNREVNCTSAGWETTPTCEFGCLSNADCTEVAYTICNTTTYECICQENFFAYSNSLCLYDCGNPPDFFVDGTALSWELLYLYDFEFGTLEGDYVAYSCPSNYTMYGTNLGYCVVGGWSGMQPLCLYDCGPLPTITNGNITFQQPDNTTERATATVTCDTGYKESASSITCLDTGQWENAECILGCGNPVVPTNGSVFLIGNGTLQGDVATYSCDVGYKLIGNKEVNCTSAGWETAPICEFGCLSDADCTEVNTTCNITTYECLCEEKFVAYSSSLCLYDCGNPPDLFVDGIALSWELIYFLGTEFGTLEGDTVVYSCPSNYIMSGSDVGICEVGGWSGIQPLCLYDCGNPEVPANGSVLLMENGTLQGDVATYSCDTGYKLIGNNEVNCTIGGWGATPACEVDCGEPVTIPNGNITLEQLNNTTQGATATVTCDDGFKENAVIITCLGTGLWTDAECITDCGSPLTIPNGNITLKQPDNTTEGATATVTCDPGFMESAISITCLVTGLWEDAKCIVDCGPLLPIPNGNITLEQPDNTTVGATATLTCDDGFKENAFSITCLESGLWEDAKCIVDCGSPLTIPNGNITLEQPDNTTEGAIAIVTCDEGFKESAISITCLETGLWEDTECIVDCGPLLPLPNGNITLEQPDNTTVGATATLTCDVGFKENAFSITCLESGLWEDAKCIVDCGSPLTIPNGNITLEKPDNTTEGAVAIVTCDEGFKESAISITCLETSLWEDTECIVDCGPLLPLPNGNITLEQPDNTTVGATATLTCDDGFKENAFSITCLESGLWEDAKCIVDCGSPLTIPNGNITLEKPDNTTEGAVAIVTCDEGFKESAISITCLETGLWEDTECIVDCGPLLPLPNGNITLEQPDNTTVGATATLTCDVGFKENAFSITCLESGLWEDAKCIVDCGPLLPLPNGNITLEQPDNTTVGATATLTCDVGFKENAFSITCLESGLWEDAKCIVDCGSPLTIPNGNITLEKPDNTTEGAIAIVTCDEGFKESAISITCLETGLWEDTECIVDCGPLLPLPNGNITLEQPDNTTVGATATLTCNVGFKENAFSITCLESGLWEDAKCIVDCGSPLTIPNGNITLEKPDNTTEGAIAIVTCDEGFKESAISITCLETGLWEDTECIVDCGPLLPLPNGNITLEQPDNTTVRATATLTCNVGFKENAFSITCLESGLWEDAKCIVDCGSPLTIPNGNITLEKPDNTTEGAIAIVTCDEGFKESAISITCLETGLWEDTECIVDCGPLLPLPNGNITLEQPDNTTVGATATLTCDDGFKENAFSITCLESGLWEDAKCIVDCGSPLTIPNGNISLEKPDNTTEGAIAIVTCDEGLKESAISITCLETGLWEDTECIVDCGPLLPLPNGNITLEQPDNTTVGATATLTCDVGFKENSFSITCLESGLWEDAKCIVDCGSPLTIPNGNITLEKPDNTTEGAIAIVTCDEGFKESAISITCLETGLWEDTECIVDCGSVLPIPNGKITLELPDNTTVGATATLTCDVGFKESAVSIRCLESGQWEDAECIVDCGSLLPIPNGNITLEQHDNTTVGATATVRCDVGFKESALSITCLESGLWVDAECIVDCGSPLTIPNGNITLEQPDNTTEGATATATCDPGFKESAVSITCLETGLWEDAECIVDCGSVLLIPNGNITLEQPDNTTVGATGTVRCDVGFKESAFSITCLESGLWEDAKCIVDCGPPKTLPSANITLKQLDNTTVGATAIVTCDNGFKESAVNIICLGTGEWEDVECIVDCGPPLTIANANITLEHPDNTTEGAAATVNCDDGFKESLLSISCLETGVWEDAKCIVDCGLPFTITHGNISMEQSDNTTERATAIVTCDDGFKESAISITCLDTGQWEIAECIVDCGPPPKILSGNITLEEPDNTTEGAKATVICDGRYKENASSITCLETGHWGDAECIVECGQLKDPPNGSIDISTGSVFGALVSYSCVDGFILVGDKTRVCEENGIWSGIEPVCAKPGYKKCSNETDWRGTFWHEIIAAETRTYQCGQGFKGTNSRQCKEDGTWDLPQYGCMREAITNVKQQIELLDVNATQQDVISALNKLEKITQQNETTTQNQKLTDGEIIGMVESVAKISHLLNSSSDILSFGIADAFIGSVNNLVDTTNLDSWRSISQTAGMVAESLLKAVDAIGDALAKFVASGEAVAPIVKLNIALQVKLLSTSQFNFPDQEVKNKSINDNVKWLSSTKSKVQFNPAAFQDTSKQFVAIAAIYKNLSEILLDKSEKEKLNEQIVTFATLPRFTEAIDPPIKLTFQQSNIEWTRPTCSFWKFQAGSSGYWSSAGCNVSSLQSGVTECECDHLTNFAVLLSLQDCGSLEKPANGKTDSTGTIYNSTAKFRCDNGYSINGSDKAVCQFNGSWSSKPPDCTPKDCGPLNDPGNGKVEIPSGTTFNAIAVYSCDDNFELEGTDQRVCLADGSWSLPVPACNKREQSALQCEENKDNRGFTWNETQAGIVLTRPCDDGFTGYRTRKCRADGTWQLPHYNCVRESVQEVNEKVSLLTSNATEDDVSNILKEITHVSVQYETGQPEEKITDGELSTLSSSLEKIADVLANNTNILNNNTADTFIEATSSLLDKSNQESWRTLSESESTEAAKVLKAVDKMTEALSKNIKSSAGNEKVIIVKKNVALEVKKFQRESVVFPNTDVSDKDQDRWINQSQSSLLLNSEALKNDTVEYVTTAVMYRDMSDILPTKHTDTSSETPLEDTEEEESDDDIINAPILALSIFPRVPGKLIPPIRLTFQHNDANLTSPSCVFWKFKGESSSVGYWSPDDCKVNTTNDTFTVCECEHLTNFAVLMSPFAEADASSQVLRIISIIGIGVSLVCLIVTFCVHFCLWKYLRSDHTTVLMNLCVALIISYIIFLGGVDRTESTAACSAIAAVLHYMFLVVFFIMLVEGTEITITVLYVFKRKSRVKLMLILAWACPAVIVGISLGVTKLEGYGNKNYCWLAVEDGLIWAFVGPVLLVIALNAICLAIVIRTMFQTKSMETKKAMEKIKTSFRSLCVLVPVMGICWIVGIFYVNDSFYFIQYIFAILNGLQGFFIFLFHCLLNTQVKKALSLRERRRSTLRTTLKSTSRSGTKEDRPYKDLRETGRSYLESSGEFVKDTSDDWKNKILQPQLSQEVVKFSTPLRFSGTGRRAASFSAEARDQLIGDTTKPFSEQTEHLSERLQSQLLSARL